MVKQSFWDSLVVEGETKSSHLGIVFMYLQTIVLALDIRISSTNSFVLVLVKVTTSPTQVMGQVLLVLGVYLKATRLLRLEMEMLIQGVMLSQSQKMVVLSFHQAQAEAQRSSR